MILKCFCDADPHGNTAGAEYQNKRYGFHRRVHNEAEPVNSIPHATCTVCGRKRPTKQKQPVSS